MGYFPLDQSVVPEVVGLLGYLPLEGWKGTIHIGSLLCYGQDSKEDDQRGNFPNLSPRWTLPDIAGPGDTWSTVTRS